MYVLSIVAGVFLPLGLLTGLLGIDVGGIPGADDRHAFLIVCLVLAVIAAVVVWVFRPHAAPVNRAGPRRRPYDGRSMASALLALAGRPFPVLPLLVFAPVAAAQVLTHGQMVGPVDDRTAVVWARTSSQAWVSVLHDTAPSLANALASATVATSAARDHTVRVPLAGLQPGTRYWYAVRVANQPPPNLGTLGPVGTFATAPARGTMAPVTFAFSGDVRDPADYGLFAAIAARSPDFYVSLGDFPYADGAVTLSDYWSEHKALRASPLLHAFWRSTPFVAIWDDHEVVNNWDGATDPGLVQNGVRAWFDYFPLPDGTAAIHRSLRWGDALELFLLDCRSQRSANGAPDRPGKRMLGSAQMQWLQQALLASDAVFKVIATSVPLRYASADSDSWDGFVHEREELLGFLAEHRIADVLFVTADQHWAALHHLHEGVREYQTGPLATGTRSSPDFLEPEQRWQAEVRNFATIRIDPAATPPTLSVDWFDAAGRMHGETMTAAGGTATLAVESDVPEGGFRLVDHTFHVRDRGAGVRRGRIEPGSYRMLFSDLPWTDGSPATVRLDAPVGADLWVAADHDDGPDAHPVLLARDFDVPLDPLADFTIVDQGTLSAPSAWIASGGCLNQTSNIHTPGSAQYPGTMAVAGDAGWTDYTLDVRLRSSDDDSIGVVFRYTDAANHYRVRLDHERRHRELVSVTGGGTRTLGLTTGTPGYARHRWTDLQVVVAGDRIVVRLDGETLWDVTDPSHPRGAVGLYTWGDQLAHFDDLVVRSGDASARSRPRHHSDDFGDGVFTGWTVIDQGAVEGPSVWQESGGVLLQQSNIHDGDLTRGGLPKRGTIALAGPVLDDQEVVVRLANGDDDAVGAVLRYVDEANYYRFSVDRQRAYRRLVRVVGGQWALLWEDSGGHDQGPWHRLQFSARGDRLRVCWDGETLCEVRDGSLPRGRCALYCWGSPQVRFDDFAIQVPPIPRAVTVAVRQGIATDVHVTAPASAGLPYLMAVSLGRSPGIPLGLFLPGDPRVLALNDDPFFQASLRPNPVLVNFAGVLDPEGRATGTVRFPPIALQQLSGVVFHAGGLVLEPAVLGVREVLPTVPLVVP